ncbi:protein-L-isoaspartate O-methyltransferase [Longimycelium tulufanense]|uniref:Protein-L-isoaspartate O-methyltransferase n=1 Tax=Longimycelium tulufanense TaxID=907463 RepID=A0A8J3CHA9_9PSEU|nr:ATP-grasp peptide maturase system methyltransferase [Longimycelium tulufanense]GGM69502.1 protein-L-isoaspartate O-methyltransferase [Longimycelium tulufanense]
MRQATERLATKLRERMVAELVEEGALRDRAWREAFLRVPRHVFLPRFFRQDVRGRWAAVAEGDRDWLRLVYLDRVWVTQLDGDDARWDETRRNGPTTGVPTSSSSEPSLMALMLEDLDVHDGHRVLEIGTGTGYNAALVCHRLGSTRLSTVDVDDALVRRATERLSTCGFHPTVATADGALGYPPDAPYDRVLGTCAVARVPLPWLAQTRPGGLVLTTLHRPLGAGLVLLTVHDAEHAEGRVLPTDARFMPLRAHSGPEVEELLSQAAQQNGASRGTRLGARTVTSPGSSFEFFAGTALPGVRTAGEFQGGGPQRVWLLHPDGSWARHTTADGRYSVEQSGPRRLWDEVEAAHTEWVHLGRPERDRFGLTVTGHGQWLWLDHPESPHRWPL